MEFIEEQAAAGGVGLEPFAVDDQLGNGALANVAENFSGGGRICIHVDF